MVSMSPFQLNTVISVLVLKFFRIESIETFATLNNRYRSLRFMESVMMFFTSSSVRSSENGADF